MLETKSFSHIGMDYEGDQMCHPKICYFGTKIILS